MIDRDAPRCPEIRPSFSPWTKNVLEIQYLLASHKWCDWTRFEESHLHFSMEGFSWAILTIWRFNSSKPTSKSLLLTRLDWQFITYVFYFFWGGEDPRGRVKKLWPPDDQIQWTYKDVPKASIRPRGGYSHGLTSCQSQWTHENANQRAWKYILCTARQCGTSIYEFFSKMFDGKKGLACLFIWVRSKQKLFLASFQSF